MYGGDEVSAILIVLGSHSCKAGYAGEDAPRQYFPLYNTELKVHYGVKKKFASVNTFYITKWDHLPLLHPMTTSTTTTCSSASHFSSLYFSSSVLSQWVVALGFSQFHSVCHLLNRKHNDLEMRRWILTFKYHKEEAGVEGEEEEAAPECVICLSPFDEGEDSRQLSSC